MVLLVTCAALVVVGDGMTIGRVYAAHAELFRYRDRTVRRTLVAHFVAFHLLLMFDIFLRNLTDLVMVLLLDT